MIIEYKINDHTHNSTEKLVDIAKSTSLRQYPPASNSSALKKNFFCRCAELKTMHRKLRVNNLFRGFLIFSLAIAGFNSSESNASDPKKSNVANNVQSAINTQQEKQTIILTTNHNSEDESPNDLAEMLAKNKRLKEISEQQTEALSRQMEDIEEKNKRLEKNILLQNQQIEMLKEKIRLLSGEKN